MKDDYEINGHIKRLGSIMIPTSEELRMMLMMVNNQRQAYMDKLMCDGHYFSKGAIRERKP